MPVMFFTKKSGLSVVFCSVDREAAPLGMGNLTGYAAKLATWVSFTFLATLESVNLIVGFTIIFKLA